MKNKLFYIYILILFLSTSCDNNLTGSKHTARVDYDYTNFSSIVLGHGCQASVNKSDSFFVSIEINENFRQFLLVSVFNNNLTIDLKPNGNYSDLVFNAKIGLPSLEYAKLDGGSSTLMIGNFEFFSKFILSTSGGSSFKGNLTVKSLQANLSGGSSANISGGATNSDIILSGGSSIEFLSFPIDSLNLISSGGSTSTVTVNDFFQVDASGGSTISYAGTPTLGKINITGGSTFTKL